MAQLNNHDENSKEFNHFDDSEKAHGKSLSVEVEKEEVRSIFNKWKTVMSSHADFGSEIDTLRYTMEFFSIDYKFPMKGIAPAHGHAALKAIVPINCHTFTLNDGPPLRATLDDEAADILRGAQCKVMVFFRVSFDNLNCLKFMKCITTEIRIIHCKVAELYYVWILENYRYDGKSMPARVYIQHADKDEVRAFLARFGTVNDEILCLFPSRPDTVKVTYDNKPRNTDVAGAFGCFSMTIKDALYKDFEIVIYKKIFNTSPPHKVLEVEFKRAAN